MEVTIDSVLQGSCNDNSTYYMDFPDKDTQSGSLPPNGDLIHTIFGRASLMK